MVSDPFHPYTTKNGFEVWLVNEKTGEERLLSSYPHQEEALKIAGTFLYRVGAPTLRATNTYDFQGIPGIVVDSPGITVRAVVKGAILTSTQDPMEPLPEGGSTDYIGSREAIQE